MAKFSNYLRYLSFVDTIVAVIDDLKEQASTKQKVVDVISDLLDGATPLIKANNTALGAEFDVVVAEIKAVLARYKDHIPAPGVTPPAATAQYDTWVNGDLPTDAALIASGFKNGDVLYSLFNTDVPAWLVIAAGSAGFPTSGIRQRVIGEISH